MWVYAVIISFDMEKNWSSLFACLLATCLSSVVSDCPPAEPCNRTACDALGPENCHCSGVESSIPILDRPMVTNRSYLSVCIKTVFQIVYLTYDDALTGLAEEQFYRQLFNGTFTNPNECAIRATHYITQSYTDYSLVNRYWHLGHEMAAHSVRGVKY